MRNVVRALKAMIAVGAAMTLLAPAAEAETLLEQIAVAHRGGAVTRFGEGTMKSYQDAVANNAQILEGDIRWTKDSPNDSDTVGSIIISHDSTLDRVTNCSGSISSWLWTSIRDRCRTDVGKQPLIRINDLVAYATPAGRRSPSTSRTPPSPPRKLSSYGATSRTPRSTCMRPGPTGPHSTRSGTRTGRTPAAASTMRCRRTGAAGGRRSPR